MTDPDALPYQLDGLVSDVVRDGGFRQTGFSGSAMEGTLCFVVAEQYLKEANANRNVTAVITNGTMADRVRTDVGLAVVADPMRVFYELHNMLAREQGMAPEMTYGVAASAGIDPSAIVAERCFIGERVVIGPGAIIEAHSHLADDVVVGPGAIVGCVGHFFKKFGDGMFRVEHTGGVRLEQGVEVLAGAIVSRAVHPDFTVVGEKSVISVGAHVGHGCRIGKRTIVAGRAQISGYTIIGDDVWIGPSAVVGNLRRIGDGARVELGSAVVTDVPGGRHVSGNFAYDHVRRLRQNARDKQD